MLYPNEKLRMPDDVLEEYIKQLLESHRTPTVTVAWQGGEPTLMGLEFYRRSIEYVRKYQKPEQRVEYTFQTNGVLLDDEWAAFFKEHDVLVGLSVDGPRDIHDAYRVDKGGPGHLRSGDAGPGVSPQTWRQVQHPVHRPRRQRRPRPRRLSLLSETSSKPQWMQFIPIIERATLDTLPIANLGWRERPGAQRLLYTQSGSLVTKRSVTPEQYGRFLIDIFEEWVRKDVGKIYVQLFDVTLEAYFGAYKLCIHAPTCGYGPAIEHNGDVYTCDHYVEPAYRLGNIGETHMIDMVASPKQRRFGLDKQATLTRQCLECDVRFLCNGGCPKDRFVNSADGEPGHNYLCAGFKSFFDHVRPGMETMAQLIRSGQSPVDIMQIYAAKEYAGGRNGACYCGTGKKFKRCHGTSG